MLIDKQLAHATGIGAVRRIEVRNVMNASIEDVWDAITNIEKIEKWWTHGSIDLRVGGRFVLEEGHDVDGTILACFRPYIFEFTWNDAPESVSRPELLDPKTKSTVRIDLVEHDDDRTKLTLIQYLPPNEIIGAAGGWHEIVGERLGSYLEDGTTPDNPNRFSELKTFYAGLGLS